MLGGSLAMAGIYNIAACHSSQTEKPVAASTAADCTDLSTLTEEERAVRQQFGYESPSSSPDRQCQYCSLYILPSSEKPCAGCLLFKGPVQAEGSCIQFAAKVQQ